MFEALFDKINVGIGAIGNATGIGSKSRARQTELEAGIMAEQQASQSKNTIKILAVSGVLILVITVIFFTLRNK